MKNKVTLFYIITLFLTSSCGKDDIEWPEIKGMVFIPAGEFTMGTDKKLSAEEAEALKSFGFRKKDPFEDATPAQKVFVDKFYIDEHEVTNSMYLVYLSDIGYQNPAPSNWLDGKQPPPGKDHLPVNNVSWEAANAFCFWANKRLPTEAEWEKAARGPKEYEYPWGNEFNDTYGNFTTNDTAPVKSHKKDKSGYGVYDMGGNVMEWVQDFYQPYQGNNMVNKDYGKTSRVIRGGTGFSGGHYIMNKLFANSMYRQHYIPTGAGNSGGFRCAASINKDLPSVMTF